MHLLLDRHLACFCLLATVNSASVNMEEDVSLTDFFFLEHVYTNMLEHMVALFFGFGGIFFSTISVLVYIPMYTRVPFSLHPKRAMASGLIFFITAIKIIF